MTGNVGRVKTGLTTGGLLPEWEGASVDGAPLVLHRIAGVPMITLLLGRADAPGAIEAWRALCASPVVRSGRANLFAVVVEGGAKLKSDLPTVAVALDRDGSLSRACGALEPDGKSYRPFMVLTDPMLRVVKPFPMSAGLVARSALEKLVVESEARQAGQFAPVLSVPNVFEPELCRRLIEVYRADGGEESGFMREVDGRTVLMHDPASKRRRDASIEDPELRKLCQHRIHDRLAPMIERAFGWRATRLERYIVARYDSSDQGWFRRHRDNTSSGTAHRKFAVTINLNAEEFEGGELLFPEFGRRTYRAETGGAIAFGCNLLHEARPVTKGERFAFLPFLYDDAGALLRERNAHLNADPELQKYRASEAA